MFRILNFNLRHLPSKYALKRIKVRPSSLRYSQMRSKRWGKDEILALSTWLLVGTGAFVLIGTTTSASLALLLANSLQFQGKTHSKTRFSFAFMFRICCW